MRRALALCLVLTASCGVFAPESQLEVLARQEMRWQAINPHNYQFDYVVAARASPPPVRIDVVGDVVTRVVNISTGAVIAGGVWPTVDSLFAWTRRDLGIKDYKIQIIYDGSFHFPATVSGDIPNAVDDEFTRKAFNFSPGIAID